MEIRELITIILKTGIGYLILILTMRFMGKREIGQLNLFDLIILLTIVDLIGIGLENYDKSLMLWIVPVIILAIIQKIVAIALLKFSFFRTLIDGKESLIINQGKLVYENMRKNNYNFDDLFVQLRLKEIKDIKEVEFAILETNGELSVFRKSDSNGVFPIPLLISGTINKDALKSINKNKKWFVEELKKYGYSDYKRIKLVTYVNYKINILDDYK